MKYRQIQIIFFFLFRAETAFSLSKTTFAGLIPTLIYTWKCTTTKTNIDSCYHSQHILISKQLPPFDIFEFGQIVCPSLID